jgi:hypothetical protein
MRKIILMILCLLVVTPSVSSCATNRKCKAVKMKKKWAKKNYWKPKKHKRR